MNTGYNLKHADRHTYRCILFVDIPMWIVHPIDLMPDWECKDIYPRPTSEPIFDVTFTAYSAAAALVLAEIKYVSKLDEFINRVQEQEMTNAVHVHDLSDLD